MKALYGQFIKSGDLVFNIGANVGIRTPVFLDLGAKVVALEPQPSLCEILRSKVGDRATVIEAAAGAKEGEVELWLCSQDQLATCSKAWADSLDERWPPEKWNRKITVPMITLDSLIKKYGIPDFVKIDVEGYEIEVLKGLSHPLKALSFEFTITYLEPVMECLDYLVGLGMGKFNYIIRDEMRFILPEWVGAEEMKAVLRTLPIETFFGDIFALPGETISKVLVTMPIVKGKIYPRAMDSMYGLEWTGQLDFLLLIGGDDPKTLEENVVNKYNVARDVVLQNGYDALLTLESDIIAPPSALKRLVAAGADVAYGLYVWKNGWPYWNAYAEIGEKSATPFVRDLEWCKEAWGKVREVAGIGNGCTLIQRHVLERFPFRKPKAGCADWGLSLDCQAAGFIQKCDLGVICGHIQTEPLPRTLWPDITKHGLYRATDLGPIPVDLETNALIYLKDMEGTMKVRLLHRAHLGRGLVGNPGDIVNMTKEEAKQMIWHGIAEEVVSKRKAKEVEKEDEQDKGEGAGEVS